MVGYSNEEILRGILKNNSLILRYIYKTYFHKIFSFVTNNKGNSEEANDVFQEAIIVIYRKLKEDNLAIANCSFDTYLFSVCRLLWLKQLQIKREDIVKIEDLDIYSEKLIDDDLSDLIKKNERYKLFQDHFQKLGKDCQKILQLFFKKAPIKQITEIMGYASDSYTKKRKHQCKEYLVKSIKQDNEYKKLINYDS
ncbi:MAG TPA: sigma-70 family RNA polymerase sigma factor [Prolixibacteraceae bacterium]|nr:sigma-70 family RNA polymerase sigma factor [Prolixibacteraceae bacterium]